MMELNLHAIDNFLKGETVEGKFGKKELGRDFEPPFYHTEKIETW
jgi:hypothetical protein